MDSLSQLALGAAVGVAVMGRRTRPWKAAAFGALAGTLPDSVPVTVPVPDTAAAGVVGTILAAAVAWGVSRGVRTPGHDAHR